MSTPSSDEARDPESEDDGATYDLEPAAPPSSDVVSGDDAPATVDRRCQNCGAPMPEDDSVMVCPSCGYDIVTNRVIDPASAGTPSSEDLDDEDEPSPPLVADVAWKPFLIPAGVLLASVAFAMIAGWSSFFPREEGRFFDVSGDPVLDAPRIGLRFAAVLKLFVGSGVLVACGVVAARATAWFEERPLGDLRSVASRLTLAVATAAMARVVPIESVVLQNIVHGVLGLGAIVGITMLAFGNRGRIAGLLLVCWGIAFLLVVPLARLVAWSIPIF